MDNNKLDQEHPPYALAFPFEETCLNGTTITHYGMSLREYIATKIMASIAHGYASPQEAARDAVLHTDALIAELNK